MTVKSYGITRYPARRNIVLMELVLDEIDLLFLLQISHAFLSFLERLVVVLIEKFPELGRGPQFLCCKAMLKLFLALATKGASLKSFLSQIGKSFHLQFMLYSYDLCSLKYVYSFSLSRAYSDMFPSSLVGRGLFVLYFVVESDQQLILKHMHS